MNEATRVIRAGTSNPVQAQLLDNPAFVEAKPESVILYSFVGGDRTDPHPVMIRLSLNAQRQLVEDRWAATVLAGGYSGFPSPHIRDSRLRRPAVDPHPDHHGLATYGHCAVPLHLLQRVQGTVPLAPAGTDVPAVSLAAMVTVKVSLTVQKSLTDSKSPVTLENLVGIPNLNASATIS